MSPGTPSIRDTQRLIYAGELPSVNYTTDTDETSSDSDEEPVWDEPSPVGSVEEEGSRPQSMYLTLFEDALTRVLEYESHLFNSAEIAFFQRYNALDYGGKYILVRLCLRRSAKWIRVSKLQCCQEELGDAFLTTLQTLIVQKEPETIDLTRDDDDGDVTPSIKHTESPVKFEDVDEANNKGESRDDLSFFLHGSAHATLAELLECLMLPELKDLCKTRKIRLSRVGTKGTLQRAELIAQLLDNALPSSQPTLDSSGKRLLRQSKLPFANPEAHLRKQIMNKLKLCVRINQSIFRLVVRVNLIYFRCTQLPTGVLIPSILKYAKRRNYEQVPFIRTSYIWPSRMSFIEYERALVIEAKVDDLINPRKSRNARSLEKGKLKDNEQDPLEETPRQIAAKQVKDIVESVYPHWKALLQTKDEPRAPGLERFEEGHVLTRIVQKGAEQLYVLKDYAKSLEYTQALLSQYRWRRSRRGLWHETRALILMNHAGPKKGPGTKVSDVNALENARKAVIEGLMDSDTHLVYRPALQRRLARLEKKLKLGPTECHTNEGRLVDPKIISIPGTPAPQDKPLHLDKTRRPAQAKDEPTLVKPEQTLLFYKFTPLIKPEKGKTCSAVQDEHIKIEKTTGRTSWIGRDGEVVNVETLALQYYENQGYSGYHCEGGILFTIFGLLFWDIIFAPIPGAFETDYQSAPLDFAGDNFYMARQDLIDLRLQDLRKGHALYILDRVDSEYREKKTWCIGVRWEYPRDTLREIVQCFDGAALAILCELLCQDYAKRRSGMPDLFLWDFKKKHCKLVEVKSPNDKLQENQKVWIDVLHRAEVDIEVCCVGLPEPKATKGRVARKKRAAALPEPESEDEEIDELMYDSSPGPSRKRAADSDSDFSLSKRPRRSTRSSVVGSP
ncbi:VRR-NUC domain-containing protein [Amylostereum chailletii]|nr:VRR-NUC domain-containing protein [Amylostereum chailletii]